MTTRRRLLTALRPVVPAMALSIAARVIQLSANLVLVAGGAFGVASLALGSLDDGWGLLALLAAVAAVKAVARYVEQYQGHHVAFGLLAGMRTEFFHRVAPLAPAALADLPTGDLVDRVTADVDRVEVFYAHTLAPALSGVVVPMLAVAGVGVWSGPGPALVLAFAMLLVGWLVPAVSARAARASADEAAAAGGRLAAHITDGVQGLHEAVVFDYGDRRLEEMETLAVRVEQAELAVARIDGIRAGLNQLLISGALVAVAALGAGPVQAGTLDPAVLAATLAVSLVAFAPLADLQQVRPAYDRAMASADRVFAITDRSPVVEDPAHPVPPPEGTPTLELRDITFAYPGRPGGVADIQLTAAAGRKIGIVGSSGAGKSTVARLAVRLWDPDSGRITLDGRDVADLELSELRRRITVVTQESHLLSGTVADNLRLGRPDAAPEEIARAARTAAVADDIAALAAGYDTQVGELGVRLSGGQRQRIALARGLLADRPVIILDEATSELDVDTEAEVLHRLGEALAERVMVVIAHRLAAVTDADEILVMDGGRIVERGTHPELLARNGLYARLWARQREEL